jgi:hypothetical protein
MGSGVSGRRGVWRKGAMRGRAGGAAGEVAPVRWGRGTRRCRTVGNCPQKTTFPIPRPWVVGLPRYYPIIILAQSHLDPIRHIKSRFISKEFENIGIGKIRDCVPWQNPTRIKSAEISCTSCLVASHEKREKISIDVEYMP